MLQPVKIVGRILLLVTIISFGINFYHPIASAQAQLAQNYRELLDRSEKEKRLFSFSSG